MVPDVTHVGQMRDDGESSLPAHVAGVLALVDDVLVMSDMALQTAEAVAEVAELHEQVTADLYGWVSERARRRRDVSALRSIARSRRTRVGACVVATIVHLVDIGRHDRRVLDARRRDTQRRRASAHVPPSTVTATGCVHTLALAPNAPNLAGSHG